MITWVAWVTWIRIRARLGLDGLELMGKGLFFTSKGGRRKEERRKGGKEGVRSALFRFEAQW